MSHSNLPGNHSSHWYCHVTFDVTDPEAFISYLRDQVGIERQNGMTSYEFFVDQLEHPTKAVLIECFPDDVAQQKHLENVRAKLLGWLVPSKNIGPRESATIDLRSNAGTRLLASRF